MILLYCLYREITIQAMDQDNAMGPLSATLVTFDRSCTEFSSGILSIPSRYPDYQRLELCTAIGISRIEIVDSLTITNLQFMRNIRVSII